MIKFKNIFKRLQKEKVFKFTNILNVYLLNFLKFY